MKRYTLTLDWTDEYYIEEIKKMFKEKYKNDNITSARIIRLGLFALYEKMAGK